MSWQLSDIPAHLKEINQDLLSEPIENPQPVKTSGDNPDWEGLFLNNIRLFQLPEPKREYLFHPDRKWRFDFAYPDEKIAIEVEGGIWTKGRHTRGSGFIGDCEKYNEAVCLGWSVLRVTPSQIENNQAIDWLMRCLK